MVCCVCLLENPDVMAIFDPLGQQLKVAKVINKHFWIKPLPNDTLTSQICTICWHKIDDFNLFYQTVEKAHKEYQQLHQVSQTTIKEEEKPSFSTIKLEQEEIFEGNLMQTEIEIDFNLDTINPLEGHNIDEEVVDNDEETDDNECGGTSDEYEPSDMSEHESSNEEEETLIDIKTKIVKDDDDKVKKSSKRKSTNNDSDKNKEISKKKRTFNRLDPVYTEEMIKKHIPMGCNMCVFVGGNFSDIVEHFKTHHPNVRPYIMCCDKKLTKRFYVAQHALKHEDPNCFRCQECNKSFTTTCGLRTHNLNYHAPEDERIHSCELCPKKFARRNLLELHKPSHIPREQWKFLCKICSPDKTFASQYLLNIHNSMQHKREKNICHVCAKEIKDKHSFEKHVRSHFEDSGPRVKCPYADCDSWLKDEDNLRQHLQRHNPEGKTFKCDTCDKICKNRRALTNHKRYSHSNEIFQCEQCDKAFKKAISLREHMTQHTGETLYKCPFCPRTFNSNANMHSHKKKQHPIEWEEWRRSKRGSAQVLINNKNPLNPIQPETFLDLDVTHLCEQCNKSFASIRGQRAHDLKYHPAEEECIYKCEICPKKFAARNLLDLHKTSHIPREEWQFSCKQCPPGKNFASEFLLNIHISMLHKKEKNICQVCAKEIKDNKHFEKHVRSHFEDGGPRVKCQYPNCESWLKDDENLRIHMRRHIRNDNAEGKMFKCPECDKVCKNINTLKYHKQYTHSNKIFTCEVCDKSFKRAISLREHMTQHTGETLYKCPFCPKTFNSNANMHSHKKKQHPAEWEEWRINKRGSSQALINC